MLVVLIKVEFSVILPSFKLSCCQFFYQIIVVSLGGLEIALCNATGWKSNMALSNAQLASKLLSWDRDLDWRLDRV